MSMKSIAVIPARYASTRFPGKLLMNLGGKTIIQHVWERTKRSKADDVLIAVDDQRVFDAARAFGAEVVMTSPDHPSGSDRIWEAVQGRDAEAIINVQGDEPFVKPQVIDSLIDAISADDAPDMATVVVPCPRAEYENNPNMVKVVMTADNFALYFSRSMIPFLRAGGAEMETYRHWGIYAYRRSSLARFLSLPEGNLEKCEKLEQLRALENGMRIKVIKTVYQSVGIDTPEELVKAEQFLAELKSRGEVI